VAVRPRSCLLSQRSRVRMRVRTCLSCVHLAAACCGVALRQLQPDSASRREVQVFWPELGISVFALGGVSSILWFRQLEKRPPEG
jgi:hypothetical protein